MSMPAVNLPQPPEQEYPEYCPNCGTKLAFPKSVTVATTMDILGAYRTIHEHSNDPVAYCPRCEYIDWGMPDISRRPMRDQEDGIPF